MASTASCSIITLTVHEVPEVTPSGSSSSEKVFQFSVKLGEEVVLHDQRLSRNDSHKVRELSWRYVDFFGWDRIDANTLTDYGMQLFSLWLEGVWGRIKDLATNHNQLLIASNVPAIINLPWELVYPSNRIGHLGLNKDFDVRRQAWVDAPVATPLKLTPGPLRILFMVCAPTDQVELDYEKEEYSVLSAISEVNAKVVFHSGDLGMWLSIDPPSQHGGSPNDDGGGGVQAHSTSFENCLGWFDLTSSIWLGMEGSTERREKATLCLRTTKASRTGVPLSISPSCSFRRVCSVPSSTDAKWAKQQQQQQPRPASAGSARLW